MAEDDSNPGGLGWSLLGEIQAEGLRAAGTLVERLVRMVDGPHAAAAAGETPPPLPLIDDEAISPWIELWRDVASRTTEAMQRLEQRPATPVTIAVQPGGRGEGEMWLHNGTGTDPNELVPHCGPLTDAFGTALACEVDFDPPKIDGLPPRSSRGFIVALRIDANGPAGTFRGIVHLRGAEAIWVPIEVVVGGPE